MNPKSTVLPVERADVRTGLRLDRRGRPMGVELQQEGPIAGAPLEDRFCVAPLGGEVEVVLARGDLGQEVAPTAANDLLALRFCDQPGERVSRRDVRQWPALGGAPLPRPMVRRLGQLGELLALARADDEQPRPGLRHAEVGGVEHLPVACVSSRSDLIEEAGEGWPARPVVERQRIHVLQHEEPRPRLREHPRVRLQEGRCRVDTFALPVEPEARLRERHARRAAHEEVWPFTAAQPASPQDVAGAQAPTGTGRERVQITTNDLPKLGEGRRRVLLHGVRRILVPLHGGHGGEPGSFEPEVEPACTGEQRDDRADGHAASLHGRRVGGAHPWEQAELHPVRSAVSLRR